MSGQPTPGATSEATTGRWRTFAAFRYRDYRILWLSMAVAFTGMMMQGVARGWLAFELTGEHSAVGIVMLAWGVPQLVFSLLGGAIADRVDKRLVMLASQSVVALTALATGIAVTADVVSIEFLFAIGLIQGTVFAFNLPARQALMPEIVPREVLMNALALNNSAMNASSIVAPAIAGLLMSSYGVGPVFYVQALLNGCVVLLIALMSPSRSHLAGAERRKSVAGDIKVGLRFIWGSSMLRLLMVLAFVPSVLGMPFMVLLPGFADTEIEAGESGYGLLLSASGVGALAGSMALASLSGRIRIPLVQAVFGLGFGLGLVGLGLGSGLFGFPAALVALLVIGLTSTCYMTLNNTLLMQASPQEFYGRVMSVYMITFSLFPVASWPLGMLADSITAKATFVLLGAALTGFIVLVAATRPRHVFGANPAPHTPEPVEADRAPATT